MTEKNVKNQFLIHCKRKVKIEDTVMQFLRPKLGAASATPSRCARGACKASARATAGAVKFGAPCALSLAKLNNDSTPNAVSSGASVNSVLFI